MGVTERKERQRAEREKRIIAAARQVANVDGWPAVTIRRLAEQIEYSQPVLYSHFQNRDAIIGAVALEGFVELAEALHEAIAATSDPGERVRTVSEAYVAFASGEPTLYEAMFILQSDLRFAHEDTPAALRRAFAAFRTVVEPFSQDADIAAETLWSALHGLGELDRTGRTKPEWRTQRLALVVEAVISAARLRP